MLPIELTNDEIRNTKAYKEYYACATREAAPKLKASARRKRSGSDTSITPPTAITTPTTTVAIAPRLTAAAKGKQQPKPKAHLTPQSEDDGNGEEDQGLRISEEERLNEEEEADELYRDQESSSVSSQFVTSMLNPTSDASMESIFVTASSPVAPLQTSTPIMTPSTITTITTISHAPIPLTTIPREFLQNLPTFDSVFRFEDRLKSLEANFSKYIQTNLFAEAVSNILGIVHQYMNQQMNEAVRVAVQIQTDRLRDSYQRENDEFLRTIDENMKRIIKEQVKADLSEMALKKILIEKMEGNKSIQRSDEKRNLYMALVEAYESDKIILDTYGETVTLKRRCDDESDKDEGPSAGSDRGSKRRREGAGDQPIVQSSQHSDWFSQPKKPPTLDHDWNKTLPAVQGSTQIWISELAKQADSRSSFNELLDTPLDFSKFIMHRLRIDALTPEPLAGPTYELMKGSCTSLIELEYHLEEAIDYGNIKWIEDLVPRSMWIQEPINYGKHALWGVSHWGQKRQQFYGFAVNWESALDVYSKRRIITVTDFKIVEWHSYKHLD
nr:hypothetical protein [Tanacetum cinerariifolium]